MLFHTKLGIAFDSLHSGQIHRIGYVKVAKELLILTPYLSYI